MGRDHIPASRARIGVCCLPATGHLVPACALASALQSRGHEVILFGVPDAEPIVRRHRLRFCVFGGAAFPAGTAAARDRAMAAQTAIAAVTSTVRWNAMYFDAVFRDAPGAISAADADLLVIDQGDFAAHIVAEQLGIRVVTVAFALPMNDDPAHARWSPEPPAGERRTAVNEYWRRVAAHLLRPLMNHVNGYRMRAGLAAAPDPSALWSSLAQITQQPAEFDYPRPLPEWFHYTGPFLSRDPRPTSGFPRSRLNGKPLVYAAFGTMVNRNLTILGAVVEACATLDVQLAVAAGGSAGDLQALPADTIVMAVAPQLEVLSYAQVMVTHAGLNSTLECLSAGVPMVAIPITNDAPAVAARIAWTRTGVVVPPADCTPARLAAGIGAVLGDPAFRASAASFRRAIAAQDGAGRAAEIIEEVLATGKPVARSRGMSA